LYPETNLKMQGEIKNLIQYPYEKVVEKASGLYDAACLDILTLSGIVDKLAEPSVRYEGLPVQTLASAVDMDPVKLAVIMRYLAADGWVSETKEGHFRLCRPSLELLENGRKWIKCVDFICQGVLG
jgi:hypothetical protein